MPWRETSTMDERLRFVQDVHRPGWSIAELCRRYEVSRKTGYKWLKAYEAAGPAGLADGEYWSRLIITAKGGSLPVAGADPTQAIQVGLSLEVRTIIPLQYRKGNLKTGVRLANLPGGCASRPIRACASATRR